jgi:hypothetical protein
MLFTRTEFPDLTPPLTGVIDFENAHTAPLYYLYEYPVFIQDVSWYPEQYPTNALLRAHFVRAVWEALPPDDRGVFVRCMNDKGYLLSGFWDAFMLIRREKEKELEDVAGWFLTDVREGTEKAYQGRVDAVVERYDEQGRVLTEV